MKLFIYRHCSYIYSTISWITLFLFFFYEHVFLHIFTCFHLDFHLDYSFFFLYFFLMKRIHRFGITGWPWVTSFHLGEKVEDMAGLGGAQSVVNWAQKMVEKTNPKGGVSRLSDE